LDASSDPEPGATGALTVTRAGPPDGEPLERFFARNRDSPSSEAFDPFELTAERARSIASARSKDLFYLARLAGDAVVALSMLRGFDEGFAIPSFGLLVDHEHQDRGIGRQLTVWTLEAARAQGCAAVRLSVYASNDRAIALYHSLGFVERSRVNAEHRGKRDQKLVMMRAWEDGAE
jgi:GNAT superfamily N-acetyltransferase